MTDKEFVHSIYSRAVCDTRLTPTTSIYAIYDSDLDYGYFANYYSCNEEIAWTKAAERIREMMLEKLEQ